MKGTLEALSVGFFVGAYLLAVFDGAMSDKGLYPSDPGRMGIRRYAKAHPWNVLGALFGVMGVVVGVAANC